MFRTSWCNLKVHWFSWRQKRLWFYFYWWQLFILRHGPILSCFKISNLSPLYLNPCSELRNSCLFWRRNCLYISRKLYKGSPNISKKCWSLRRPLHFLWTCLLKAGFGMEVQPHWQLFQFQKDFTAKGYKNYWYYSFQIQIKVKTFENVRWKNQVCL